jgi:hypothetical protein
MDRSSIVEASMGAGGNAEERSSLEFCVDTEPPGRPNGLVPDESAVASGRGESSGLAIRSPPKDWERLRSPFMTKDEVV